MTSNAFDLARIGPHVSMVWMPSHICRLDSTGLNRFRSFRWDIFSMCVKLPRRSKQWIMLSSWFPTGPVRDPKICCCDGMVTVWENIPNLWLYIFNSIHAQDFTGYQYSKCHSHPNPISITDQHRSNSCLHRFVVVPPLCMFNLLRVLRW